MWGPVEHDPAIRAREEGGASAVAEDLPVDLPEDRVSILLAARASTVIRRELQRSASQEEFQACDPNDDSLPAAWGANEMLKMNDLLRYVQVVHACTDVGARVGLEGA